MKRNRVCIFIDGSNFYHLTKMNDLPTNIDYNELSKALAGDRTLVRTYYYNSFYDADMYPDRAKAQTPFYEALGRVPYLEVRLSRLMPKQDGGFHEKGVDVKASVDMVYYAALDFYDTAILVSGDQDFAPALLAVKEMGKHVEVAAFANNLPRELHKSADRIILLNEVMRPDSLTFLKNGGARKS